MNVSAHQKKENNNMGKAQKKEEKERQVTNFKATQCCHSAVAYRTGQRKNDWMWREPEVTGTFGKANSHFERSQTGSGAAPPR